MTNRLSELITLWNDHDFEVHQVKPRILAGDILEAELTITLANGSPVPFVEKWDEMKQIANLDNYNIFPVIEADYEGHSVIYLADCELAVEAYATLSEVIEMHQKAYWVVQGTAEQQMNDLGEVLQFMKTIVLIHDAMQSNGDQNSQNLMDRATAYRLYRKYKREFVAVSDRMHQAKHMFHSEGLAIQEELANKYR